MIMLIHRDELKQYVDNKPLPGEIKRYAKMNSII